MTPPKRVNMKLSREDASFLSKILYDHTNVVRARVVSPGDAPSRVLNRLHEIEALLTISMNEYDRRYPA